MGAEQATVDVDGTRVPYTVAGTGPALVLIHGTGAGAKTTWGDVLDRYTGDHTVLLPDLAGSEQVEDDGGPLTIASLANQVAAVIRDAGLGAASLLGLSLGAVVAAAAAATRPGLIRRLILAAGWSRTDAYIRNLMTTWLGLIGDAEAFGRFAVLAAFSPGHVNGLGEAELRDLIATVRPTPGTLRQIELNLHVDIQDLLPTIRAETLVIGCRRDHTIPVEHARGLAAAIPNSSYAEFAGGHVVHVEHPMEFVRLTNDFATGRAAPS